MYFIFWEHKHLLKNFKDVKWRGKMNRPSDNEFWIFDVIPKDPGIRFLARSAFWRFLNFYVILTDRYSAQKISMESDFSKVTRYHTALLKKELHSKIFLRFFFLFSRKPKSVVQNICGQLFVDSLREQYPLDIINCTYERRLIYARFPRNRLLE